MTDNILEIITIGDPILRQKADKIKGIDKYVRELADEMVNTMRFHRGFGLAAPQVGQSLQLITIEVESLIVLINPEIIYEDGEATEEEACLSIPGIFEMVPRPWSVSVRGLDLDGEEKVVNAEGLLARALYHEIDHINGKLFIDRLSPLKRSIIRKKLKKWKVF